MGSITITVPQNIQVNYTVENMSLTRSLLDLLNAIMLRSSSERREDDSLLGLFADKSDLIAGYSKRTFMEVLGEYGVSIFNYTPARSATCG